MSTIEIECSVECEECGKTLVTSSSLSRYGAITIRVEPCAKCLDSANNDGFAEGKAEGDQP
jgi:hypothetical protein